MKLPFEKKDFEDMTNWIQELADWSAEKRTTFTLDELSEIYLLPLTLALLKSASTLSRLTWVLMFLTGFLVIERVIWIVQLFR